MSRKDTHAVRSHRSKRGWKPRYKGILHYERKRRKQFRKMFEVIAGRSLAWLPKRYREI